MGYKGDFFRHCSIKIWPVVRGWVDFTTAVGNSQEPMIFFGSVLGLDRNDFVFKNLVWTCKLLTPANSHRRNFIQLPPWIRKPSFAPTTTQTSMEDPRFNVGYGRFADGGVGVSVAASARRISDNALLIIGGAGIVIAGMGPGGKQCVFSESGP